MSLSRTPFANLLPFVALMAAVVAASNFLVQYQFNHFGLQDLLTWGAFTYPVAFLINDLANRRHGPVAARRVVMAGFLIAVAISFFTATPRIAIASGTAFLAAQLIDTSIFHWLRGERWWRAPLVSSVIGSILDTILFFGLAFAPYFTVLDTAFGLADQSLGFAVPFLGREVPLWVSLAVGDFGVKLLVALAMLAPYGMLLSVLKPAEANGA